MQFDKAGNLTKFGILKDKLLQISLTGKPFITGGCPGCNRTYYTIDPGERHYTYPGLPSPEELQMIVSELGLEKT
jgi:biotin synthase-related radical SAM superfamily protein